MIFDRHANLKCKYGNRHFRARGYYVDTVGRNKKQLQTYIKKQLQEDEMADQMSLKEYTDPFAGSKNTKAGKTPKRVARNSNARGRPFGTPLGVCQYPGLLGLSQATSSAGGFDSVYYAPSTMVAISSGLSTM